MGVATIIFSQLLLSELLVPTNKHSTQIPAYAVLAMDINYACSDEGIKLGQPQLDVSKDEIESFRALKFSWTKITRMLGISRIESLRALKFSWTKIAYLEYRGKCFIAGISGA